MKEGLKRACTKTQSGSEAPHKRRFLAKSIQLALGIHDYGELIIHSSATFLSDTLHPIDFNDLNTFLNQIQLDL